MFRAALTYQIASWLHLCGLTSERTAGPERGFSQNCTTSVIELMRNVEKNASAAVQARSPGELQRDRP